MSKIRNKAKAILVEWLKTLLNEEEQKKVNVKNILTLLPNQTHYFSGETFKITTLVLQMGSQEVKTQPRVDNNDLNAMLQPSEKNLRRKTNDRERTTIMTHKDMFKGSTYDSLEKQVGGNHYSKMKIR